MASSALVALGEELVLVLDRSVREQLGLGPGVLVDITCDNGVLTVTPRPQKNGGGSMSFEEAHDDITSRYESMLKRLA